MIEKSRRKSAETRAIDTPPAGRVGVHDTNYGLSSLYILCGCLFTEAQIPMISLISFLGTRNNLCVHFLTSHLSSAMNTASHVRNRIIPVVPSFLSRLITMSL